MNITDIRGYKLYTITITVTVNHININMKVIFASRAQYLDLSDFELISFEQAVQQ